MTARSRQGFSFIELAVGIVILFCGIIPIFWVLSGSNKAAKLTISQVQATNHATNLLEAVRAAGYDAVSRFPPAMVQLKGGTGVWKPVDDPSTLSWVSLPSGSPNETAKKAFDSFRQAFFDSKDPIVPPIEEQFERYLAVRGGKGSSSDMEGPGEAAAQDDGMIGVVVRIEWTASASGDKEGELIPQSVELRTVLGDPYRFLGGGGPP
jgi:hypothetical protein